MHDSPAVVSQNQEHIQDLKADRRHGKEVNRHHSLHMVVKEASPGLGGWLVAAHQVLAHARLADVDAELEQLTVNPRSAPEWVLTSHGANQLAHLFRARKAAPAYRVGPSRPRTTE